MGEITGLIRMKRRSHTKRTKRRSRRRRRRTHRKQKGGFRAPLGFLAQKPIGDSIIRRSLDDDMYSPPTLMNPEQFLEQIENSERA